MKGKFRILGHVGLALFVACALMLAAVPAAKVEAATAVTNVWVQFTTSPYNINHESTAVATDFTIHFTPDTALSRGVDTITVWFPDGATAMGPAAFSLASAQADATYYVVDANGEALGGSADCTSDATLSTTGHRITVTTPVDLAADTACSLRIETAAAVKTSVSTSRSAYKVKVYTSQDTTPVPSDAFYLDDAGPTACVLVLSPETPDSAGQYTFTMTLLQGLTAGVDKITVIFPYGTTIPAPAPAGPGIDPGDVSCQNDGGNWETCTVDPTINQKARTITITTPITLAGDVNQRVRFSTGANIKNPTTVALTNRTDCYVFTSKDQKQFPEDGGYNVVAGTTISKIGFNNDAIPASSYSDSATMVNMYSDKLYVEFQDAYGNLVHPAGTEPYISFRSSHAGTGIFYSDTSGTQISSIQTDGGNTEIYYRDTTAGEVTLTAESGTYEGTWTINIAPGVELRDSVNNLIKTFAPTWASGTAEATDAHSGDYIQSAINAAVTGDTVKLGGTADDPAIYELDAYINLTKKVTLTSATSKEYTTLRPATEGLNTQLQSTVDLAILVRTTGTAANPVIIDGLTFTRLRSGKEFDIAVHNNAYNYVTVRNCVFDYIIPEYNADHEWGAVVNYITYGPEVISGDAAITSATISNNTFTNCCPFAAPSGGEAAVINVFVKNATTDYAISGTTVSGNTLTNCNGLGIAMKGLLADGTTFKANVTDNILTDSVQALSIQGYTDGVNVLRNTVSGAYTAGIYVETTEHVSLVIKNNSFTGCAGADKMYFTGTSCVIRLDADAGTLANVVQYNAISDNDALYSIYAASGIGAQDCKYNWFGDATGPYYSALPGATVGKSNTGGAGKKVTDLVTYYPWLHKSLTDVRNDNASYQACTVKLVAGWNTLSTPVQLISTANTIDDLIPAHMTLGYWYDAFDADAGGDYWEPLTGAYELKACDAVYVKMSIATDVLLKFDAKTPSTPSKELAGLNYTGWNLISLAYLSSSGKSDLATVASVKLTAAGLPGYSQLISPSQNATQTDMFGVAGTSWTYSSGQSESTGGTCFAGLGYWIYMLNDATLAGFEIAPIAPDLD